MHADRANMVLTTILLIIAFTIGPILLVTCWSLQARKRAEIRRLREEFKLQQTHTHQNFLPTQGPLPPGSAHGPRLCSANGFVVSPRFVSANGQLYGQPPPNLMQPPYYCTSDGRPFVPYFHEDDRLQYFPPQDQRHTWGHYPLPPQAAMRQQAADSMHNGNALLMRTEPVSLRPHLRERPTSSLRQPDDQVESEPSNAQDAGRQPQQNKWTSLFPTIFRASEGGENQPARMGGSELTSQEADLEAARRQNEGLTSCRTSAAGGGDVYGSQGQNYFHLNEEAPLRDALLMSGIPAGPYPYQQGGFMGPAHHFGGRVPPLQQERITIPSVRKAGEEEAGASNSTKDCSEYNVGPNGPS